MIHDNELCAYELKRDFTCRTNISYSSIHCANSSQLTSYFVLLGLAVVSFVLPEKREKNKTIRDNRTHTQNQKIKEEVI